MKVRFYNFSKRKNSTLQPSSTYTEKDVAWKDETSTHDPSVICSGGPNMSWTYAYIPDWDKYYFVEDAISLDLARTEYVLTEDVMATHKTEIGSNVAYIEYSTTGYDKLIPDPRIAISQGKFIAGSGGVEDPIFDQTGCYVLSVMNKTDAAAGIASCYVMDQANMTLVGNTLCDTSFSQALCNFFHGDLKSGILGCIWVPFTCLPPNVSGIWIGDQIIYPCNAYKLSDFSVRYDTFQLPIFIRYGTDDFRSYEPYTTGTIYLPGAGNVELNMSDWYGSTKISVYTVQEWCTGDCTYQLFSDAGQLVQTVHCNVASECPLGGINNHYQEAGYSMLGALGSAAVGSLAGVAAGLGSAILSFVRHSASIGGHIGGRGSALWPYIQHSEWSVDTEDPFDLQRLIMIGAPVGHTGQISDYPGYIKCRDANMSINGSARERDEVNEIVNSGFYYD